MNSVTQGLLAAGCEVRVLSLWSDKHPVLESRMTESSRRATRVEAVQSDLRVHPLDAGVAVLCGESYHVKRFISKEFAHRLAEVLDEERFDVVHVESVFMTPYVPIVRVHSEAKVILRAHNVEHEIWRKVAQSERNPVKRWYLKHLSLTLAAYEREHLNDYDGVVSITANDERQLREMGCRRPMLTVPFSITPETGMQVDEEPDSLFHIGSMDWMPNLEGVRWFLKQVWPKVHERMPQLTLYLAGRKMPKDLMQLETEGVRVLGEVPDAMYFIASKQINVVPLLSGSGMRVKIIEAMSAGKAVVTTTIGAAGIGCKDGENVLIADTPEQFVEQLQRCVDDPEYRRQIGCNAARLIVDQYGNEQLTQRLIGFYEQILNRD